MRGKCSKGGSGGKGHGKPPAHENLATTGINETQCCCAEKTELWVDGPDGVRWEWYVKHADSNQFKNVVVDRTQSKPKCCR